MAAPQPAAPARSATLAGAVSVATALASGELLAGIVPGVPSPLLAVASFMVDVQPPGAKDFVVGLFGTADKLAFQVFIVLAALLIGAGLGLLGRNRPDLAGAAIATFAAAGFLASLRDPEVSAGLGAGVAAAEALIGIAVLRRLLALAASRTVAVSASAERMPDPRRRSFLQVAGALAVTSLVGGPIGRLLLERRSAPPVAADLPEPSSAARLPAGADIATADLLTAGMTPIVIPNEKFYRIDKAFIPPTVDRDTWKLRVTGLVDREVELSYAELVQLEIVEQFVTIACVSNEVGGNLVGNAIWTGVPLRTVLDMAGVQAAADQLVGISVDGFTAGMPVEWVMDESRVPMIAIGMNGQPLPREHGYPARLIVPGLYGYVSATKWLTELRLTTFATFQGYWVPLGWAAMAPILTQSRIDVPRPGSQLAAGRVPVGGVAWAPDRGIRAVEVRIDGGEWRPAILSAAISAATWVQWRYGWDAPAGDHVIEVRATDGNGDVQTDAESRPAPDGARGHHEVRVRVA